MSGHHPIRVFNDILRRLEELQREKHVLLCEKNRLLRLREHLVALREYKTLLPAYLDSATSALSYHCHAPIDYFTDRYIAPSQHSSRVEQLYRALFDDQIRTVNAFSTTNFRFTNVSALGGVLGCQTGCGGRIVPLERAQCFREELRNRARAPPKKESDFDFDRAGSTLTVIHDYIIRQPQLLARKQQVVPVGRVLYDANAQREMQRGIYAESAELFSADNVIDLVAANLAKLREQTKQFCAYYKFTPRSQMLQQFERDKCEIRKMKNLFQHETDFSLSPGWKLADEMFEMNRESYFCMLESSKQTSGLIQQLVTTPIKPIRLPDTKPINPVARDAARFLCGKPHYY